MGERFDLPSGAWVQLREPEQITWGQRRNATMRANAHDKLIERGDASDEAIAQALFGWIDFVILAFVEAWSYDFELPSPDLPYALDNVPTLDRDALDLKCVKELWPKTFLRVSVDEALDPDSPTEPSGDSESAQPEGAASEPTTPKSTPSRKRSPSGGSSSSSPAGHAAR